MTWGRLSGLRIEETFQSRASRWETGDWKVARTGGQEGTVLECLPCNPTTFPAYGAPSCGFRRRCGPRLSAIVHPLLVAATPRHVSASLHGDRILECVLRGFRRRGVLYFNDMARTSVLGYDQA